MEDENCLHVVKTKLDQSTHLPVLKRSIKTLLWRTKDLGKKNENKGMAKRKREGPEAKTFLQEQEENSPEKGRAQRKAITK